MTTIYDFLIKEGYGLVNLGCNRGLFYSRREFINNCPQGWLFVASEDVKDTSQLVELVDEYKDVKEKK